jgi:hypothetical protein
MVAVVLIGLAGLSLLPDDNGLQSQDTSSNTQPLPNLPAPADIQALADYIDRVETICTAAHTRLHRELEAAGVELHSDEPAMLKAQQRIMGETLADLRAVAPPVDVAEHFDHLYGLMERFADGEEMPYVSDAEFWVHQVTSEPSLSECIFDLPG